MEQENSSANSAESIINPDVDFSQEDGLAVDSGDFFESLDREVNGMILDKENTVEATGTKETQVTDPAPAASFFVVQKYAALNCLQFNRFSSNT